MPKVEYLTIEETARRLGIGPAEVEDLVRQRRLMQVPVINEGMRIAFRPEDPDRDQLFAALREMPPADVQEDLKHFEQRFGMSSTDFWKKWQAGDLPQTPEYVDWALRVRLVCRLSATEAQLLTG